MRKHKNRKFIRKSCFTLFELLISVGLLVVLSVVLLRTLVLTSDYWIKTDEQAQMQADAKTLFSLLSDDLGNLIYTTSNGGFYAPLLVENNKLGIVTHGSVQTKDNTYSDVCKVVYEYHPWRVERKCSSDAEVNGDDLKSWDLSKGTSDFYSQTAVKGTVIDTVIEFTPQAYYFEGDNPNELKELKEALQTLNKDNVRMIHVKLVLLPEKRHAEYNGLSSEEEKRDYIRKHGRIFYKAFWINPSKQ